MVSLNITQAEVGRKDAHRSERLREAEHKNDDKKQVPVEHHHAAQLDAIMLALIAMQDSRNVNAKMVQEQSVEINALSVHMTDLNRTLAGMNNYQIIAPHLSGDDLTEAIANAQTQNSLEDALRSIYEGEYGNDKLEVQQKQSETGADVNAIVQQLQQAAGLLNQLSQLSNVVSGR